ncbi:hypothetical protein HPP92_005185 [Vanilla planifolia]|uniref:WRKY domain-containing protein n=1 Tax=Vanilla planifolia TaxID=51239 RepID=A0A835RSZ6_VANPL|nr:hypothetical protein HPP92_005486 [Vanilla planifolia]KAG0494191.1 hypothetical protein HPP92_005185 [Vanilla planifolia]
MDDQDESSSTSAAAAFADHSPDSPSLKRSRRPVHKRVLSTPEADVGTAPPSDLWAWRKYGQKPIKGSPYPRGYYRCSSSKGCPARKQVERSRADPTTFVVTYSSDHNHPRPSTKAHRKNSNPSPATAVVAAPVVEEDSEQKFSDFIAVEELPLMLADDFRWPSNSSRLADEGLLYGTLLDGVDAAVSRRCEDYRNGGGAVAAAVNGEEEEMFAGLGELPECSMVFRQGIPEGRASDDDDTKRCRLETATAAASCGSSG